jgi:hypothetical protein
MILKPEQGFDFEAFHEQKKIDKMSLWKAKSNIEVLMGIFSDTPLYAMFGTLLGLVREGDLIEGDVDVDLMIREEDLGQLSFYYQVGVLKQNCFRLVRVFEHEGKPAVISFLRFGELIDFYVGFERGRGFEELPDLYEGFILDGQYWIYEGSQLSPVKIERQDTTNCERGLGLHIIGRADRYLEYLYGKNWVEPDPDWYWGKKYVIQ